MMQSCGSRLWWSSSIAASSRYGSRLFLGLPSSLFRSFKISLWTIFMSVDDDVELPVVGLSMLFVAAPAPTHISLTTSCMLSKGK